MHNFAVPSTQRRIQFQAFSCFCRRCRTVGIPAGIPEMSLDMAKCTNECCNDTFNCFGFFWGRGSWASSMPTLVVAIFLFIVSNVACSTPDDSRGAKNFYDIQPSPSFVSLGVRGYQQTFDYSCGPSSVMSLLRWYGALADQDMNRETEMRVMQGMHCNPNFGTRSQDMAAWLNDNGFDAQARVNGTVEQLIGHLKNGIPVLVEWLDWGGHWVVLTGAFLSDDDRESTLFFADPAVHWYSIDNPRGISSFSASRFGDMVFVLCFICFVPNPTFFLSSGIVPSALTSHLSLVFMSLRPLAEPQRSRSMHSGTVRTCIAVACG